MLNRLYSRDKKWIFIISLTTALILSIGFYFDFFPKNKLDSLIASFTSNVITFMSIYFGFYFTSMSALFSSKYITYFNEIDKKKPNQRKIHTLIAYFFVAVCLALLTIVVAFILSVVAIVYKNFIEIIFFVLCYLLALNLFFAFLILRIFVNALIVQSQRNE